MNDLRSLQDMFNGTGDSSAPRKPKPLGLADMLDADARSFETKQKAARELRRLHKENEALRQALAQPSDSVEHEPEGIHAVLFAVEQAVRNGCAPWDVEEAYEKYEAKLKEKNT